MLTILMASSVLARPQDSDDGDGQDQAEEHEQYVHDAHDYAVCPAPDIGGERAKQRTDDNGKADGDDTDEEREA